MAGTGTDELVALLGELIRHDTRNPEGDELPLAARLGEELSRRAPDEVRLVKVPRKGEPERPRAYVWARWGEPRVLINAHLDTVPANEGWSTPPHTPVVRDGSVYGLGACDTKAAIAATLAALDGRSGATRPRDLLVLFSGDEELSGTCVRAFLASGAGEGLERAVVCEPTGCRAGVRHRGVLTIEWTRRGAGGHSSGADRMVAPIAELARLAVAVDDWGKARREQGPPGFEGMCVNIASLDGGVAFNVVPEEARLCVSLRPPPGADQAALKAELLALGARIVPEATAKVPLDHATFATRRLGDFAPLLGDDVVAAPLDLPFWTEAAVLSAAGIDCVVIGPGDIARAHAPDEHVPVAQLERMRALMARVVDGCR